MSDTPFSLNINLSAKYVPDWHAAQAVRELYANCLDAAPFVVDDSEPNMLILDNPEATLTLDDIVVLGQSSKRDANKIGQFGEGLKLAAAVLLRDGHTIYFDTPVGRISFNWDTPPSLIVSTLHAYIDPARKRATGVRCVIGCPGVVDMLKLIRCPVDAIGPVTEKRHTEKMTVYCKGIYVTTIDKPSLFDWNLPLKLNRDRAEINQWDTMLAIAHIYIRNGFDHEAFYKLLDNPDTVEAQAFNTYGNYSASHIQPVAKAALIKRYGDKVCLTIPNDTTRNQLAAARGYKVLSFHSDMAKMLKSVYGDDLPTSAEIITRAETFSISDMKKTPEVRRAMREFTKLMDLLSLPAVLHIFDSGSNPDTLGYCRIRNKLCEVYLADSLFLPGMRTTRLGTLCHELGHVDSNDNDGSLQFENSLTNICGILASHLIK